MVKLQFNINAAKFGRLLAMLLDKTIESTEYAKLYVTLSKEDRDLYSEIVDGVHAQGIMNKYPTYCDICNTHTACVSVDLSSAHISYIKTEDGHTHEICLCRSCLQKLVEAF